MAVESFLPENFCLTQNATYIGKFTFNVVHPSGAFGAFEFEGKTFGRSRVPYLCAIDFFDHQVRVGSVSTSITASYTDWIPVYVGFGINIWVPIQLEYPTYIVDDAYENVSGSAHVVTPNYFGAYALIQRTISGSGISPQVTGYSYGTDLYPYCDQIDSQTGVIIGPTCVEDPCPDAGCMDGVGRWTEITLPSGDKLRNTAGASVVGIGYDS